MCPKCNICTGKNHEKKYVKISDIFQLRYLIWIFWDFLYLNNPLFGQNHINIVSLSSRKYMLYNLITEFQFATKSWFVYENQLYSIYFLELKLTILIWFWSNKELSRCKKSLKIHILYRSWKISLIFAYFFSWFLPLQNYICGHIF